MSSDGARFTYRKKRKIHSLRGFNFVFSLVNPHHVQTPFTPSWMMATKTVNRMVLIGSQMSILDWNCFSQLLKLHIDCYFDLCRRQFAGSPDTYNGLLRTTGKERGRQLGNKNITWGKKSGGRVASFFVFLPLRTVFGNLETRDALSSQMLWC